MHTDFFLGQCLFVSYFFVWGEVAFVFRVLRPLSLPFVIQTLLSHERVSRYMKQ
jgi:hypothetical protein